MDERDENKEIPASGSAAAKEGDHPEKRTANEHVEKSLKTLTPYHMAKHFYSRISNQYGWRLFSWGAPFNVTVAADRLRDRYAASYVPHDAVDPDVRPVWLKNKLRWLGLGGGYVEGWEDAISNRAFSIWRPWNARLGTPRSVA